MELKLVWRFVNTVSNDILSNNILSYRPGSQNVKADALSRMHHTVERKDLGGPILPSSLIVAPVVWDVDEDIRLAAQEDPAPAIAPQVRVYVPTSVRDRLLIWAYTTLTAGHSGIMCTLKYWWPTLASDVSRYVNSCSVCAQTKTTRNAPAGKLVLSGAVV